MLKNNQSTAMTAAMSAYRICESTDNIVQHHQAMNSHCNTQQQQVVNPLSKETADSRTEWTKKLDQQQDTGYCQGCLAWKQKYDDLQEKVQTFLRRPSHQVRSVAKLFYAILLMQYKKFIATKTNKMFLTVSTQSVFEAAFSLVFDNY